MAHPFSEHRQSKVEHSRVGRVAKGYASGGAVHDDAKEDATQIKRMVKPSALKVEGKKATARMDRPNRARGGRTGTVNVIIAPQEGANRPAPPAAVPAPAGVAPVPMTPPPRLPPPGPMPPAGAGAPPMPLRNTGGRAYARGGAVRSGPAYDEGKREGTQVQHDPGKNDLKDVGRGKPITYKRGGAIEAPAKTAPKTPPKLDGGGRGGKARLQKAARAAKTYARPT